MLGERRDCQFDDRFQFPFRMGIGSRLQRGRNYARRGLRRRREAVQQMDQIVAAGGIPGGLARCVPVEGGNLLVQPASM